MLYSDLYFQSKRRTSIVLVICAVISIVGFLVFFSRVNTLPSRASKRTLKIHSVVNLSARQAGIYWQTDTAEVGWVVYGDSASNIKTVALDERDVESMKSPSKLHFATLKNLKEGTTYYYKIVSGNELLSAQNGDPFTLKTAQTAAAPSSLKPAYGKIIQPNGEPVDGAFVLLEYKNTYPLLAITKLTGEWLIPLQGSVDRMTGQNEPFDEKEVAHISIIGTEGATEITARISKINPVPQTLVLGRNYTLLEDSNVLPASTSLVGSTSVGKVDILFPREGSIVPGSHPLIKGTGIAGASVKISLNTSPPIVYTTSVGADGNWSVGSTSPIVPGAYTVTLRTLDKQGGTVQLSRRFTIGKSGEQVLGDATPSATLTPSTSPTATPTTAPGTPTATPTELPTLTPTTSASSGGTLTPTPTAPVTGLDSKPFLIGSLALIIAGAGVLLVF